MKLKTYRAECVEVGGGRRFGIWYQSLYKAWSAWNIEDLGTQLLKFDVGDVVVLGIRKLAYRAVPSTTKDEVKKLK
nr:MAG TPA: hypothetical protein [Caudoviricetes sp.]